MIKKYVISIAAIAFSSIIYRGGFQKIPYSSAHAFFSQNNTENFAAVNKLRFLIDSYRKAKSIQKYIKPKSASLNSSIRSNTPGPSFIESKRPNIILIILEGIPSLVLDSTYKNTIKIPNLRRLQLKSYSFSNVFASGFRTDQGLTSLLSGIPAYPYINVLKDVDELSTHPSLFKSLKSNGYHTTFHYGGDSHFSSIKKYLLNQKVDFLMDQEYFSKANRKMDWGVPDHILFNATYKYIRSMEAPFFSTILTSSTHLPFDYPNNDYQSKSKKENFIGSIEYLDQSLGSFIDSLTNYLENTLFILTSDHGCLYLGHDFNDHKRFKVPFFIFGDALKKDYESEENTRNFNTHDLPLTLNSALNLPQVEYPLSSDMTTLENSTSAYWVTEHTMGWHTPYQSRVSNHECSKTYFWSPQNQANSSQEHCEYFNSTLTYLTQIINGHRH